MAMDFKEGTRRLALLLGVVGAILGGFASYVELRPVMRDRADHQMFEQLGNSPAVQQARDSYLPPWQRHWKVPPKPGDVVVQNQPQQSPVKKDFLDGATRIDGAQNPQENLPPGWTQYAPSELNSGGIKTVYWTGNLEVASIETTDGETLYPTPVPSLWLYLLITILPVLGFFIPWGATRAIGWVGAGFAAGPK